MTSEEIIQRLLDEKRISVSEALILLKDIAKETIKEYLPFNLGDRKNVPMDTTVVMYGIGIPNDVWTTTSSEDNTNSNQ